MDDIETRVVAMDMVIAMGIPEDFADVLRSTSFNT